MAIDEKVLADINPSRDAVSRLKNRRPRLRPWESHLIGETLEQQQPASQDSQPQEVLVREKTPQPKNKEKSTRQAYQPKKKQSHNAAPSQLDDNKITVRRQLDDNKITNPSQLDDNKVTTRPQLDDNKITKRITIGLQIDDKPVPRYPASSLVGDKRQLLSFFFERCRLNGSLNTGPITLEDLKRVLSAGDIHAKTVVHRLNRDGWIERNPGKRGKGGFISINLPKHVYQELTLLESSASTTQLDDNKITERITERITTAPSSSSNYIDPQTTTSSELPNEWAELASSYLNQEIRFGLQHLEQIYRAGKADFDTVRTSLDAFAHDLQKGFIKAQSPLALLMKLLRVHGEPYVSADQHYESPEEREEREALERLRHQREKEKRRMQEKFDLAFEGWVLTLTPDAKRELLPAFASPGGQAEEYALKEYFKNNLFLKATEGNA